jgi:3-methyladenine DNA glycosylase AlkD
MVELERPMLKAFLADLQQYADPEVAKGQKNYHKVDRTYLGVRVPQVASVARQAVSTLTEDQLLDLCDQLWQTNIHEAMVAVGKILERKEIRNTRAIWTLINRIKEDLDSWAIADHLAHAAFRCLEDHPSLLDEIEESWLHHPSFWVRRASLVYTLFLAKKGREPERPLGWAAGMVDDHEWFIQKAIGWWLRELSRHNPGRVRAFLAEYHDRMKPFAVREAGRLIDD